MATYSSAFIEQALKKVYSRGDRTIISVANELNISYSALKYWIKRQSMNQGNPTSEKERRPSDWSAEEQLQALNESYTLTDEPLQAWCRERGLFPHNLTSWKTAFCTDHKGAASKVGETKVLKDENTRLKSELIRKDKALAEAAALLILQKKFRALWEGEEN